MILHQWIVNFLFPPKCVLCKKVLKNRENDLCRCCRTNGPEYSSGKRKLQFLDSFVAVWYYEKNVRSSLLRYKFYGARSYARSYGRLLAMRLLQEYPEGFDVLTWIPISSLRKFRRGYDQVELLARAVGQELGMEPVATLRKVRNNRQQSRIRDAAARRANVLGVYRAADPAAVRDKRVLLLDDILTTGATASEAGRVLLTAGAKQVHCAAVAASRKMK